MALRRTGLRQPCSNCDAPIVLKVIPVDQGPFLAGVQLICSCPRTPSCRFGTQACCSAVEGGLERREQELNSSAGRSAGRAVLWMKRTTRRVITWWLDVEES